MKRFITIREILKSEEKISDRFWPEYYGEETGKWLKNVNTSEWDACLNLPGYFNYDYCIMIKQNEVWAIFRRKKND